MLELKRTDQKLALHKGNPYWENQQDGTTLTCDESELRWTADLVDNAAGTGFQLVSNTVQDCQVQSLESKVWRYSTAEWNNDNGIDVEADLSCLMTYDDDSNRTP